MAKSLIGVSYGILSAKLKLGLMIEELELLTKQLTQIESTMKQALADTGISEYLWLNANCYD